MSWAQVRHDRHRRRTYAGQPVDRAEPLIKTPWAFAGARETWLVSGRGDILADMPSWSPPLPAKLRPLVHAWEGFDYHVDKDLVHHGLPSTSLTVVLSFDEPIDCGWNYGPNSRYWVLASGLHLAPAVINTHGRQHGVQLSLTPAGSRALLGLPSAALRSVIVDQEDIPMWIPHAVHGRMYHANWVERFAILADFLVEMAGNQSARIPDPEVSQAWHVISRTAGNIRVSELAAHLGWSRRHLSSRFAAEFGVTPKEAARLARFQHAHALASQGVALAETAVRAGYSDQSHFNREWRDLAGQTPWQTLAEFPIIQDDALPDQ